MKKTLSILIIFMCGHLVVAQLFSKERILNNENFDKPQLSYYFQFSTMKKFLRTSISLPVQSYKILYYPFVFDVYLCLLENIFSF